MKSILDKSFRYVPAAQTNLAATFKRVRKEMQRSKEQSDRVIRPLKKAANQ